MLKTFIHYTTEREFLEAVDLEIELIIYEYTYDSPEDYLSHIRKVWDIAVQYARISSDDMLPHVDVDYTGNKMLALMLTWLEVKLQSE